MDSTDIAGCNKGMRITQCTPETGHKDTTIKRWLSFQTKGIGCRRLGEQLHIPGRENSIISTDALGVSSISREKESAVRVWTDILMSLCRNA